MALPTQIYLWIVSHCEKDQQEFILIVGFAEEITSLLSWLVIEFMSMYTTK